MFAILINGVACNTQFIIWRIFPFLSAIRILFGSVKIIVRGTCSQVAIISVCICFVVFGICSLLVDSIVVVGFRYHTITIVANVMPMAQIISTVFLSIFCLVDK
jgi:hypothetical protein